MKLNGTMTAVVVGGGSPSGSRRMHDRHARDSGARRRARVFPADARGAALAGEVARLHERLAPSATPLQPGRNLFSFMAPRPTPRRRQARVERGAARRAGAPPPPPFRLIGIAEDPGPDGPIRTAIISATGQAPFMVKEGQNVTPRYRVTKIAADVVELQDLDDHSLLRLALK